MRTRHALLSAALTLLAPAFGHARSDQYTPSGEPVRWHRTALPFVIDASATDAATLPRPVDMLGRAAAAWRGIANAPRFDLVAGALGPPGYDPVRRQNNVSGISVYRNGFPVRLDRPVLAITLVTRDNATGEILDADVLVDAWRNRYADLGPAGIGGAAGVNDWQNVITHELGHALGLVEDMQHPAATMYPSSVAGETAKRDLEPEDRASIVGAYATAIDGSGPIYPAGCGGAHIAPASTRAGPGLALVALSLLAVAAWRARRRGAFAFAACGGMFLVLAVPSPQREPARMGEVRRVDTRREAGLFITRAVIREDGRERVVEVPGGRIGDLVQTAFDTTSGDALEPGARVDVTQMPSAP